MVLAWRSPIPRKLTSVVVQLLWVLAACEPSDGSHPVQRPAKLAFTAQPKAVIPGAPIHPAVVVAVQDEDGNTVAGARATVRVALATNSAGGTLSGVVTAEAVNGVAIFSELSLDRAGTGYILTANAEGVRGASSTPFDVPPGRLAFTVQPRAVVAGYPIRPAVAVAVQGGNGRTVTDARATVTLALGTNSASGTLSGTVTAEAVNGVAVFPELSVDRSGTGYTLTANAEGMTEGSSTAFNVTPGKLAFTVQPTAVIAGSVIRPAVAVTVQDEDGNTVTAAHPTVKVSLGENSAGGILSGTLTADAVNGVVVFSELSLDRSGTGYTLTANAEGMSEGSSVPFNVSYAPATLAFGVQPRTTGAGRRLTPAVTVAVLDREGNLVESASTSTSVTVGIGTNPSGGTLAGSLTVAAVHGIASFSNLIIDTPGDGYTLHASAGGLGGASSAAFDVGSGLASVSAGGAHSCAVATWGAAYCWGANSNGQLGDGSGSDAMVPVDVAGGLTFAAVSAGYDHTCGRTISGAAYCWGANHSGQLGDGSTSDSNTPVPVAGGLDFMTVSAGVYHSCGVTTSGVAYCWGYNGSGQLGDGSTSNSPTPVPVTGALTFSEVSPAFEYSCGVTVSGKAYCWGYNENGELGNGSTSSSSKPVEVAGALTFVTVSNAGDWVWDLGRGFAHVCGVTTSGAAHCWGTNHRGQLGDGTMTDSTTPVPVAGGLTFAMVSARGFYSCGVTTSGAAYCWGANESGQLGDGSTTHSSTPVPVSGGLKFASVASAPADEYYDFVHTCGVSSDGIVLCWGSGALGNGSDETSLIPVPIAFP